LDDFHWVLAFTYHPMIDDSNYTPIRERSTRLLEAAEKVETELDNSDVAHGLEKSVEQLTEQCKALDEVVKKNAGNDVIRTRLTSIHNLFHELETLNNKLADDE
jgi:ferritin-like metal-binding protein YciE